MNNYCRNCGIKLENDVKKCPECNAEIPEKRIIVEEKKKELKEFKKKENKYLIIIIGLFVLLCLLTNIEFFNKYQFISVITPLIFLTGSIMLIYAKITMKKSKKINIIFIFYIILIIIYLLLAIFMMLVCDPIIRGC